MAIVDRGGVNNNDVYTVPSGGIPAGATVFLLAGKTNNRVVASAVDSRDPTGNVYTVDVTDAAHNWAGSLVSCKLATALQIGDTITITWSGAGTFSSIVVFYSDDDLLGVDEVAAASGNGTALDSGNTAALDQADNLVIGGAVWRAASGAEAFVQGSGFTLGVERNTSGSRTVCYEYKTVASASADNADGTIPSAQDWSMLCGIYKIDAGGGTPQELAPVMAASGTFTASLSTPKQLASTMAGSSTMTADLVTPARLAIVMAGSAALVATILVPKRVGAIMAGGATLAAALAVPKRLGALMAGDSDFTASLSIPQGISALMAGGSQLIAGLAVPKHLGALMAGGAQFAAGLEVGVTIVYRKMRLLLGFGN